MKTKLIFLLSILLSCLACNSVSKKAVHEKKTTNSDFIFATWDNGGRQFDSAVWQDKFNLYHELGISEALVGGSYEMLKELLPYANKNNIKIHAWIWTLNRPNDTIANKHPEWYAVNRKGDNSLEYRAYVDYYQWLSPFHPEARQHIKDSLKSTLRLKVWHLFIWIMCAMWMLFGSNLQKNTVWFRIMKCLNMIMGIIHCQIKYKSLLELTL